MTFDTGIFSSGGKRRRYRAILVDPPWRFETWSAKGRGRSPDRHYRTMKLADIKALPVAEIAAPDCALFMWAIDPMLPHALELGAAWGFTFKTVAFYWAKTRPLWDDGDGSFEHLFPIGTGYWTRANPEQCLLFTRGQPKRISRGVSKLIVSPRREHSRKPPEAHVGIERLVAGPYLEMFAREPRKGWTSWGNEPTKFARAA